MMISDDIFPYRRGKTLEFDDIYAENFSGKTVGVLRRFVREFSPPFHTIQWLSRHHSSWKESPVLPIALTCTYRLVGGECHDLG